MAAYRLELVLIQGYWTVRPLPNRYRVLLHKVKPSNILERFNTNRSVPLSWNPFNRPEIVVSSHLRCYFLQIFLYPGGPI